MEQDGIVARAFKLAQSGTCRNVDDIRKQLKKENYSAIEAHLSGATIRRQLLAAIKKGA